jgi:DNA-directed RNA polymerase specialized sigma24 family protein
MLLSNFSVIMKLNGNRLEIIFWAFEQAYLRAGTGMATHNQEMGEFLSLIKKLTNIKIKDPNHSQLREDIVQEVFLKLHKIDFFSTNRLNVSDDNDRQINAYIMRTVASCYMDQLKSLGISRRLTKSEMEMSGNRYESIKTQLIEDVDENQLISQTARNPDQYVFIKQAYQWIQDCFNTVFSEVKDTSKKDFFNAAFWEFDNYGMTMKEMALHLGYKSTNPTQELKRFAEKVSLCTSPHGIILVNPNEQIQILREQIENAEVNS